ncbi:glycoside hydrolase family 65 protein [Ruminococcaceae bacterium OttesenSCG-928-A16]|nr:glycoside hydrolase family 65 protein [Ruminococcaceae bacterium OttesenSCG-928-A16]
MSKTAIYPIEPWNVTETEFNRETNYRNETTFALSNGYIGTRGTHQEGYDFSVDEGLEGNFINGFYESEHIHYGEWNFGFPENSQSLLNLPNCKTTQIYIGQELFDLRTGKVQQYCRTLDMRGGIVKKSVQWVSPKGKTMQVETERLVSFAHKNRMAQRLLITLPNHDEEIRLVSELDADVENHTRKTNPLVDYGPYGRKLTPLQTSAKEDCLLYKGRTANSGLFMACGSAHALSCGATVKHCADELQGTLEYTFNLSAGNTATLDKFIVYTSSLDMDEQALEDFVFAELAAAKNDGYEAHRASQKAYMQQFWQTADIQIEGDDAVQQGLRFNLFHIMQAAGRDGQTGLGAKGLSGEGYEGHYFWDTEIYVLPVFVHTFPEIAKTLLAYRYATLEEARARARVLGHAKGALYPWRTINGQEASTYLPLGTAQYHINADVAYAFDQYVTVTGDTNFLQEQAAEVLCETARVWADVGTFSKIRGGKYCICAVTGPDEYTAFVDNNFYTNLMAQQNLYAAVRAVQWLFKNAPAALAALQNKIGLKTAEVEQWQNVADNMYLPYDEEHQVFLQDDGFWMRKEWDDSKIPPEKRHLLYENYHPLFIWRQRMAKQADSILGMYLHSSLFSQEEIARNYDFYQKVTLHHSSLSTCIFGILASQIGRPNEAYQYFMESARMDLDDYHNNFYAGIHAANMAGTWQAVVNGFAGMRTNGKKLEFAPTLPAKWQAYSFKINYQGSQLAVKVTAKGCSIALETGPAVQFTVNGTNYSLQKKGESIHETI